MQIVFVYRIQSRTFTESNISEKWSYSELFWSVFSRIRTRITPDTFYAVFIAFSSRLYREHGTFLLFRKDYMSQKKKKKKKMEKCYSNEFRVVLLITIPNIMKTGNFLIYSSTTQLALLLANTNVSNEHQYLFIKNICCLKLRSQLIKTFNFTQIFKRRRLCILYIILYFSRLLKNSINLLPSTAQGSLSVILDTFNIKYIKYVKYSFYFQQNFNLMNILVIFAFNFD